jgi:hypothetical protein
MSPPPSRHFAHLNERQLSGIKIPSADVGFVGGACLNAATLNDTLSQPAMRRVAVQAHVKAAMANSGIGGGRENCTCRFASPLCDVPAQLRSDRIRARGPRQPRNLSAEAMQQRWTNAGRSSKFDVPEFTFLAAVPNVKWMGDLHPHH